MIIRKILFTLAFGFLLIPVSRAQGLKDLFQERTTESAKSKKQLLRENELLRQRIKDLEDEVQWLKNDINERDSLRKELIDIFQENENRVAEEFEPVANTPEVTDSLLNIWYLHRETRQLQGEDETFNMDSVSFTTDVPDSVLIDRLKQMNSFMTLPYNETVKNCMVLYSEKMPKKMCNLLGLSTYYFPIFEETFLKYNLPLELKYVAIIESALNPTAVSRMGATGMWQFMYKTAKSYGLEINSYVDERRDPFTSVDAAARYLRDAYRIFGDWNLAISSYNCGSGNVNKAIKRAGGRTDFWSIYPYLPKETRGYVPLMVGAMYAINYAKEYGLEPTPTLLPARIDTFTVRKNLHFRQISEVIGIPVEDLRDLNPQYYQDIIPGNQGEYILRLPYHYSADFLELQDSIYRYKANEVFTSRIDVDRYGNTVEGPRGSGRTVTSGSGGSGEWIYYKVRSGDNLGRIAKKYHVTVKQIQSWNNLKSTRISVGKNLKVGRKAGSSSGSRTPQTASSRGSSSSSGTGSTSASSGSSGEIIYTVKAGDTLYNIAKRYPGVTAQDIMNYNGIGDKLSIGMKLRIPKK